jgi:hypothetical protein
MKMSSALGIAASLCLDLGVVRTGYAARTPPAAGRNGHYCPPRVWTRYAHGRWNLCENSRPPCRQQVRPRSDLLGGHFGAVRQTAGPSGSMNSTHQ